MNRLTPLVGALMALALLAAPAAAKRVTQDPDEVRAYWTDARMRGAKPVEKARGGEPQARAKPGSGANSWSTVQVVWPSAPGALAAHGKVFFTDNGVNYVCSGTAVQSTTESVVWTAGHCVNEGPGGYFTNWVFVPAYNAYGKTDPYGKWPAAALHATSQWRSSGDFGHDLGAARVATGATGTLQDTLGAARPLAFYELATNARVKSYGYPAAGKFNGQTMYLCDSYVQYRDGSTAPSAYGIPCGMTGGSSGGGWVDGSGQVVSVNSYGYQSLKNVMFGPVQGASASTLLSTADTAQ